jgi:large subunit ribosomal protein L31
MKAEIHPKYVRCEVVCGCGERFFTSATKPSIRVEVCSKCHPFYTGKQKLVDSAGRVERFERRWGKHIEEQKARLSAEQSAQ